jgi:hypothetical protein
MRKISPFSGAGGYESVDKIIKNLLSFKYWEYGRGNANY